MLVLTRRKDDGVLIGEDIKIHILKVYKREIQLGIPDPSSLNISRLVVSKSKQIPID